MRLGFAVAIHVDPEVLLVDEVLAVGDQGFTLKCLDKFSEFRRRNKTILLVTHTLDLVEKFCDQALWLDKGRTRAEGEPKRVVAAYIIDVEKTEEQELTKAESARLAASARGAADAPPDGPDGHVPEHTVDTAAAPADMFKATEGRWGTRELEITGVSLVGEDGQPAHVFQSGEAVKVLMRVRAHQPLRDFVFGFGIFNADGVCCYGTNTNLEELQPAEISGDGEVTFAIDGLKLVEGTYRVDVAAHKLDGYPYDYHRLLYSFRVKSRTKDVGIYRPDHRWVFSGNIRFKPGRR
jgi:hypothetical protein